MPLWHGYTSSFLHNTKIHQPYLHVDNCLIMLKLLAHSRKTWAVNPHCFNEKSIATTPWVTTQHSPAQRDQPHMSKRSWAKEQAQVRSAKDNHGSVVVADKDVNPSHAYTLWALRISWNTNCRIHTSSAACFALCPPEEAPALQRGFPEGSGDSINAASEPVKKLLLQVGYSSLRGPQAVAPGAWLQTPAHTQALHPARYLECQEGQDYPFSRTSEI